MALSGIPIDPQQCIGDSLIVLNNSFIELDSRTLSLSSSTASLSASVMSLSAIVSSATVNHIKIKHAGTGSQTSFALTGITIPSTNPANYMVSLDGVIQEPSTIPGDADYDIVGTDLVFSTAPVSGVKIVIVGPAT
jgi:hypothetical protein